MLFVLCSLHLIFVLCSLCFVLCWSRPAVSQDRELEVHLTHVPRAACDRELRATAAAAAAPPGGAPPPPADSGGGGGAEGDGAPSKSKFKLLMIVAY